MSLSCIAPVFGPFVRFLQGACLSIGLTRSRQVQIGCLRVALGAQIGQGGYAAVFHGEIVDELGARTGTCVAVKRVLCHTSQHQESFRYEVRCMREAASRSPCVMEVLDAEEVAPTDEERAAGCVAVGFMVMPLYEENLSDLVERARSCGHHLDPMDVICIFIQMVDAVRALHAEGPVAHHDIKPQNVMIQTRLPLPGAPPATTARAETEMVERKGEKATERQREPSEELGFESIALIAPAFREASDEGTRETCAGGVQDNGEPRDWAAFGESEGVGNGTFGEGGGGRGRREGAMWGVGRGDRGDKAGVEEGTGASAVCAWGPSELVGRYRAVLGDFGSCGAARVAVRSYRDVLEIKERAEALSTAPYRAPELFEPPGRGEIDERVDVWSLGCLLFYSMFGEGPFDFALTEGAGSIALAVLSGRPRWPRDWTPFPTDYKGPLARLVECCLQEAGSRCTAAELLVQAQEARREIMGDGAR